MHPLIRHPIIRVKTIIIIIIIIIIINVDSFKDYKCAGVFFFRVFCKVKIKNEEIRHLMRLVVGSVFCVRLSAVCCVWWSKK
jgi:hypothetical protein